MAKGLDEGFATEIAEDQQKWRYNALSGGPGADL